MGAAAPPTTAHAPFRRRLPHSAWGFVVGICAVLLIGAALTAAISWIVTERTEVRTYGVTGSLNAIQLNIRSGNVEVLGGGSSAVEVRRTDHFSFGHGSRETRSIQGGVLHVNSSCPSVVLGNCSANYRLTVPDNVPVTVKTGEGNVRLASYRGSASVSTGGGDVSVDAFCGFSLAITTGSGSQHATTACSPQRLLMHSGSGVIDAAVPTGRYRVEADSNDGSHHVSGIDTSADAPFEIQALSSSGNVSVRGVP
jgi:hypothetical protein